VTAGTQSNSEYLHGDAIVREVCAYAKTQVEGLEIIRIVVGIGLDYPLDPVDCCIVPRSTD